MWLCVCAEGSGERYVRVCFLPIFLLATWNGDVIARFGMGWKLCVDKDKNLGATKATLACLPGLST